MVVPVFNSSRSLADLVEQLERVLREIGRPFELILVNDGSEDDSWEVVRHLAGRYRWIRGHDLMRNYGQHNALLCGIRAARYELTVTLDDDGQNPPAAIKEMLAELEKGFDVVYGTAAQGQHGFWRNLGSRMIKLGLRLITGARFARHAGPFRLFRTRLRDGFSSFDSPAVSIEVLLSWASSRISSVVVEHRPRAAGKSNYGFIRLAKHALDMVTGFSTLPLHLATWFGFSLILFGIAVLGYVLWSYVVHGGSVPGFAFLASIIVIFAGGQLFAIGMIGEYLARIHVRSMNRPPFVVARTTDGASGTSGVSD